MSMPSQFGSPRPCFGQSNIRASSQRSRCHIRQREGLEIGLSVLCDASARRPPSGDRAAVPSHIQLSRVARRGRENFSPVRRPRFGVVEVAPAPNSRGLRDDHRGARARGIAQLLPGGNAQ